MKTMQYVTRQDWHQEPYCYDGPGCDKQRPRWMTSYPKEGKQEEGKVLKLEIPAESLPPGSRVTIEIPCCPECGDPADINTDWNETYTVWPSCKCGFSWENWVNENFS